MNYIYTPTFWRWKPDTPWYLGAWMDTDTFHRLYCIRED